MTRMELQKGPYMTRWLTLLILLASCSGCAMFDDMMLDQPSMQAPPPSSCGLPPVNVAQTNEPPLR